MNSTSDTRWKAAGTLVEELARVACSIHGSDVHATLAVMGAWASLAGGTGWTPEMIRRVEREIKAARR
jgi:hypothetical protein